MSIVTTIPISIEHVWNDAGTAIKGGSITEASFVDGVFWKKEVKHLADSTLAGVAEFRTAFNAEIVRERDILLTNLAKSNNDLETAIQQLESITKKREDLIISTTKEREDLIISTTKEREDLIISTTKEREDLVVNHTKAREDLVVNHTKAREDLVVNHTNETTTLNTTIQDQATSLGLLNTDFESAKTRIAYLLTQISFDPRSINAVAFENRFTRKQLKLLYSSVDPTTQAIAAQLVEYIANEKIWPILLDSPELAQALGYLVQSGQITEQEAAELTKDASREEAFVAV